MFWQSGQTKVAGWHLKPSAIALFQNEYQLPLIDPKVAAYMSAFSEHFFPILLVIGLATRLSALALLIMTAVIEIFVYPAAWPIHGVWATCFVLLIARGPGLLSLDQLLARRWLADQLNGVSLLEAMMEGQPTRRIDGHVNARGAGVRIRWTTLQRART